MPQSKMASVLEMAYSNIFSPRRDARHRKGWLRQDLSSILHFQFLPQTSEMLGDTRAPLQKKTRGTRGIYATAIALCMYFLEFPKLVLLYKSHLCGNGRLESLSD